MTVIFTGAAVTYIDAAAAVFSLVFSAKSGTVFPADRTLYQRGEDIGIIVRTGMCMMLFELLYEKKLIVRYVGLTERMVCTASARIFFILKETSL